MEQKTRLQWHPAFAAVLRIELEKELGRLEIKDEVQLTKKPLQMDVLLIKKGGEEPVEKNIGRIFRRYNIIEYKSPGDSLSVNDFYKVYGYACIYQSDTDRVMEIRPQELTLTFVCSRFPRKLLEHLEKVPRLSKENNYWLQHLRGNLCRGREIEELMERYEKHSHSRWYQSAMDLIVRANWEKVKEEKDMCEALRELFADELRESWEKGNEDGLKAGAEKNMIALVCRKLKKSKSTHEISEALEEPEEKIRLICEAAADYAPDYDVDGIYDRLKEREAAL